MSDYEGVYDLPASTSDAIDARVEAIRAQVRDGRPEPSRVGRVDPYDIREAKRDMLKGEHERRPEVWTQVMERHGLKWLTPEMLDRVYGPQSYVPDVLVGVAAADGTPLPNAFLYQYRPHPEGEWRRLDPRTGRCDMAFTIADLVDGFRTPEVFDAWLVERDRRRRLKRLGIVMAR